MFYWLPTPIWNVLSHFEFYKVVKRMRMDQVLVALALYCVTKFDWYSSGCPDDLVAYEFYPGTVQGYSAENIASVKGRKG